MCSGSRSSVQNAIRDGPYSASSGRSACRLRAAEPSRIRSHMPARSRSRPSSTVYASWSERMPAAAYAISERPSTPGAWPSTCSARPSFASSAGAPLITPGKFIISATPITRRRRSSASRSPGLSSPPRRLEVGRGHARRRHEVDVERQAGGRVEQPVDTVGAEHVRDLVRVGDDGRRAERQHEPCELVDEQLRRLEVHVRVDEAGDDPAPARIDLVAALVVAEPGDPAVDDRDVRLEPLPREDREHLAAADDEVCRLVTARDGETAREGCVHCCRTVQSDPWKS